MNIFRIKGYPDLIVNNVVVKFWWGLASIDLNEISRIFGPNVFPIKGGTGSSTTIPSASSTSNRSSNNKEGVSGGSVSGGSWAKRKLVVQVRKNANEWYSKIPTPLKDHVVGTRKRELFDTIFEQCQQEVRLSQMRESVSKNENEYRVFEWREPWIPPVTIVIYKRGKCVISGIDTEEQAIWISMYFATYINEHLGIPAMMSNFKVVNIVCDTALGYPLDLPAIKKNQGNLAELDEEEFPACIIQDPEEESLVSLAYPNGKMVQTGNKTFEQAIARHKRIVDLCSKFRLSDKASSVSSDRSRQRLSQNKKQTSDVQLLKINQRLRSIAKGMTEDVDDDDENTTTSTNSFNTIESSSKKRKNPLILPHEDSDNHSKSDRKHHRKKQKSLIENKTINNNEEDIEGSF